MAPLGNPVVALVSFAASRRPALSTLSIRASNCRCFAILAQSRIARLGQPTTPPYRNSVGFPELWQRAAPGRAGKRFPDIPSLEGLLLQSGGSVAFVATPESSSFSIVARGSRFVLGLAEKAQSVETQRLKPAWSHRSNRHSRSAHQASISRLRSGAAFSIAPASDSE